MTQFSNHLKISKIFIIVYHSWLLLCKYHVQPVCTFLLILLLLFIKSTVFCPAHYFIAHFILDFSHFYFLFLLFIFYLIFFPYLYLCIFSCVCISYNCTVHGADLTYISLLKCIFCIIVYVMNRNLESLINKSLHHLPPILAVARRMKVSPV